MVFEVKPSSDLPPPSVSPGQTPRVMETNPFAPLASTSRDQRSTPGDQNPDPQSAASSALDPGSSSKANSKRKKSRRGGKKKRSRRKSFAPLPGDSIVDDDHPNATDTTRDGLYSLRRNLSQSSLGSEPLLLNHRLVHPSAPFPEPDDTFTGRAPSTRQADQHFFSLPPFL